MLTDTLWWLLGGQTMSGTGRQGQRLQGWSRGLGGVSSAWSLHLRKVGPPGFVTTRLEGERRQGGSGISGPSCG